MSDKERDMILRDFLAVDRTRLANQRTLLSMVRTGLYLFVMGLSVLSMEALVELRPYSVVFFTIGAAIVLIGFLNYRKNDRKITEMYETKRK